MQKLIGVLALIGTVGWLVGCALSDDPTGLTVQELGLGIVNRCGDVQASAVVVTLNESGSPLNNFTVRYRINNGNWTQERETNEASFAIRGPAGTYEIEVRRPGSAVQSAIVIVPQEENCAILQQKLELFITPSICASPDSILIMDLITNPPGENGLEFMLNAANVNQGNGLDITLKTPVTQKPLICPDQNICRLNIELLDIGNYIVEIRGFPDYRKMMIVDNIAHYKYADLRINMTDEENRTKTFISEGVSTTSITIPYDYNGRSCPEVLFDEMKVAATHVQPPANNVVEIREHRPWTFENYPSAVCPAAASGNSSSALVVFDVLLPAGTNIDTVKVEYWLNNDWQQAVCTHTNGYQCTAAYPNPLLGDKYQVRTVINGQPHLGTNISLGNKCIVFG